MLRKIIIDGKIAKVTLQNGKFALIDLDDLEKVNNRNWHVIKSGYVQARINKRNFYLHRVIAKTPSGMETDHINGNKLDNRKSNLRICTRSQNSVNQKKRNLRIATSRFKGVTKQINWGSKIVVNGKEIWLGTFKSQRKAALAYDNAARKHYGEYANTNFN